jgi:frizzled
VARRRNNPTFYDRVMRIKVANSTSRISFSLQINKLRPVFELTTSQCSRQMRFLICSSLFPWCSDEISRPVVACRDVCEKVKSECAQDPIMKYWPSFLDCEQLPQPEKQELCMTVSELIGELSIISDEFQPILDAK